MQQNPANYKNSNKNEVITERPCKFNGIFVNSASINATLKVMDIAADGHVKIIENAILNGNFETWVTATNAADWTETAVLLSTVNQETDISKVHSGSNCCRLDIDAANSNVSINSANVVVGHQYKFTFYAKSASGTPSIKVGSDLEVFTLSTEWQKFTGFVLASSVNFVIGRNTANSNSIYIDDVTLEEITDYKTVINTITYAAAATPATSHFNFLPGINIAHGLLIKIAGTIDYTIFWE